VSNSCCARLCWRAPPPSLILPSPKSAQPLHKFHHSNPRRQRTRRLLGLVPWVVFLTVGVFAAGMAFWIAGTTEARDATLSFANAVGISSSASRCMGMEGGELCPSSGRAVVDQGVPRGLGWGALITGPSWCRRPPALTSTLVLVWLMT
jgi:hypothetical protein